MNSTISRSEKGLRSWLMYHYDETDYLPHQVTATTYDEPSAFQSVYDGLTPFKQKSWTLRNRVSWTRTYDVLNEYGPYDDEDSTYYPYYDWFNTGIEYSYDIHGNVDSMLNIGFNGTIMNVFGANAYKMIAYKYDLISGKVNEVHYNPGFRDEFYHRYEYDAENRLTDVYTTDDKVLVGQAGLEEHDAHYEYYKHGPLARTVIGQQQVQGIDYAYTLQGWLKGVNSTTSDADYDMGNDGKADGNHENVARDAYGFNLNYFTGEYAAINTTIDAFPGHSGYIGGEYRPLFNGNISSMAVNIGLLKNPRLYNYHYDQLNRIVGMDAYKGLADNSWSGIAAINDFKERVSYDANGNIKKYLRNGYGDVIRMDSLTYKYNAATNQLNHVRDSVDRYNYASDIDNEDADNYTYDAIGNLTSDAGASISGISWNVYGKISNITKATSFKVGETIGLDYMYDPSGNRVQKATSQYSGWGSYDWYVRDAQGNVMAVYRSDLTGYYEFGNLKLKEQHLYGSSRLGIIKKDIDMTEDRESVNANLLGATFLSNFERGKKQYELTNHLGNVLVTIADTKTAIADGDNSSLIDHYEPDVITANDYYPFGMLMPGRSNTELQQADNDDAPTPIHIEAEDFFNNSGGPTTETCTDTGGGQDLTNLSNTTWSQYVVTVPTAGTYLLKFRVAGTAAGHFQFKDSSLNILATVNVPNTGGSQTWTTVTATVVLPAGTQKLHFYVTQQGWNMNWFELVLRGADGGNNLSGVGGYRYGFNGKENDNDVKGEGNQQDYGMRINDPRLGRFLSIDPLSRDYPWYTPYQFAGNKPVVFIDLDGAEEYYIKQQSRTKQQAKLEASIRDQIPVSPLATRYSTTPTPNNSGTLLKEYRPWQGREERENYKQQVQATKNLEGATMDPFAAQVFFSTYVTAQTYVNGVIDHGLGIYEGIKEKDGWKIARNTLGLTLDIAPFIAFKGAGPANAVVNSSDEIFSTSIATRGFAEDFALTTKTYQGFQNANKVIQSNNPVFDLFDNSMNVVDITTTSAKTLNPSQFYKKITSLAELGSNYGKRTLQIYVKEGQYTAEQLSSLGQKLQTHMQLNNITNTSVKITGIK